VHVLHAIAVPRSTARLGATQLDARVTFRAGNETWIYDKIATDVRLRDAYQLKDGDWVEIEFP
jgi:hypothetical protein